jgi:hypothetical protein
MGEEPNKPLKLVSPSDTPLEEPKPDQNREGFLQRALNRTRAAIRNVDGP